MLAGGCAELDLKYTRSNVFSFINHISTVAVTTENSFRTLRHGLITGLQVKQNWPKSAPYHGSTSAPSVPPKSISQMSAQSMQPFLHGSQLFPHRQTDRQTDRQADRQTDRQTDHVTLMRRGHMWCCEKQSRLKCRTENQHNWQCWFRVRCRCDRVGHGRFSRRRMFPWRRRFPRWWGWQSAINRLVVVKLLEFAAP